MLRRGNNFLFRTSPYKVSVTGDTRPITHVWMESTAKNAITGAKPLRELRGVCPHLTSGHQFLPSQSITRDYGLGAWNKQIWGRSEGAVK